MDNERKQVVHLQDKFFFNDELVTEAVVDGVFKLFINRELKSLSIKGEKNLGDTRKSVIYQGEEVIGDKYFVKIYDHVPDKFVGRITQINITQDGSSDRQPCSSISYPFN